MILPIEEKLLKFKSELLKVLILLYGFLINIAINFSKVIPEQLHYMFFTVYFTIFVLIIYFSNQIIYTILDENSKNESLPYILFYFAFVFLYFFINMIFAEVYPVFNIYNLSTFIFFVSIPFWLPIVARKKGDIVFSEVFNYDHQSHIDWIVRDLTDRFFVIKDPMKLFEYYNTTEEFYLNYVNNLRDSVAQKHLLHFPNKKRNIASIFNYFLNRDLTDKIPKKNDKFEK